MNRKGVYIYRPYIPMQVSVLEIRKPKEDGSLTIYDKELDE